MTPFEYETLVANEITKAGDLIEVMLGEYVSWKNKMVHGQVQNNHYSELIDFVNFRMETITSTKLLIENSLVGDALGLSRSLLENYLLFILICRGTKYFRLADGEVLTPEEFKRILESQKSTWEQQTAAERNGILEIRKYPNAPRHVMYIFEGIKFEDGSIERIPYHYFQFRNFRPETFRLSDEDYFDYYEPEPELKAKLKEHRLDAGKVYRHYLSYDALLRSLELNGIFDDEAQKRIEAHYTFLGKYIHPTHNAMRELHQNSNIHSGNTEIGMNRTYKNSSKLLASIYLCYLTAGILQEIVDLFEHAPKTYFADTGTTELKQLLESVPSHFPYFWFICNEAPYYDKFNWAVNHGTSDQFAEYKSFENIPSSTIPFNKHILSNFENGMMGWKNARWGNYAPPFIPS